MGASASGTIFFGVTFGDENPLYPEGFEPENAADEELEWDEWLAKQAGYIDPWTESSSPSKTELEKWYKVQRELAAAAPVRLFSTGDFIHGWYDYHLALTGAEFSNYQTADEIPSDLFDEVTLEAIMLAQNWCKEHGLGFENPSWMLASTYG